LIVTRAFRARLRGVALSASLLGALVGCSAPPTAPDVPPPAVGPGPLPPPPPPPPPRLQATKFMAFGDSLTEGKIQTNTALMAAEPDQSYPGVFLTRLRARYTAQQFAVANEGLGGHSAADDNESGRFEEALDRHQPEVVLLLQGIVDLFNSPDDIGIRNFTEALRGDVREARSRSMQVFVSTLTAEKDALEGYPDRHYADDTLLANANAAIRAMAAAEGAVLVGGDGLHLTVAGYESLAGAFFEAIKTRFELPPNPSTALGLPARSHVEIGPQRPRQPIRIDHRQ
jgi:lysophospholipase L1-like esterase